MDKILTEQDLNEVESWNKLSPHRWCLIVTRARALLAQRDALKAERDQLVKERDDAVLRAHHAVNAEMKANEELTECRHALGGFAGPTYGISEEVKKVVAERDEARTKMMLAVSDLGTMTAERDTERAGRVEAAADLFRMTQARDGLKECMREVRGILFPEFGDAPVAHTRMVERIRHLLAEAGSCKELSTINNILSDHGQNDVLSTTSQRVRALIGSLCAERDRRYPDYVVTQLRGQVHGLTAERDTLAARAGSLEAQVNELLKTHGTTAREVKISATLAEVGFHDEPGSTIVSRIRAMGASRDTLAARVKELEGKVPCVPGTCPLNVDLIDMLHTAHEDGIRAGVTHDAYATFDGNGRLDCLFHKDGPMPPEAEFVIVVRKNRPSLCIPDPDVRKMPFKGWWNDNEAVKKYRGALEAEVANLRKELALVRAERDGIAKERTNSLNGKVLDEIRRATGCLLFGDNLVAAIKAMKEERDALRGEVSKNAGSIAALYEANQRMGREVELSKKEAEFGRAALEHAKALGIDTNKELGQQYRSLRRDAEAWRGMFPHGLWINADEATRIVVRYHFKDKGFKEFVVKDNGTPSYVSQPPEGHMIRIPAEYSGNLKTMYAYADGYLAGKGAK